MSSQTVNGDFVTGSAVRYFSTPAVCYFSTPWQQKILSSYLKETPKQYIEVYYRIFVSALFSEIF